MFSSFFQIDEIESHSAPSDIPTELQPTDPNSLASHDNDHYPTPLSATDFAWLHHSLASHNNGHHSTLRNKLHVALNGPLPGGYKRCCESVTLSVYKKGPPDTFFSKL